MQDRIQQGRRFPPERAHDIPASYFFRSSASPEAENILAFQWDLEGVGDARHVVAAACPPEDIQCALGAEVIDQILACRTP